MFERKYKYDIPAEDGMMGLSSLHTNEDPQLTTVSYSQPQHNRLPLHIMDDLFPDSEVVPQYFPGIYIQQFE